MRNSQLSNNLPMNKEISERLIFLKLTLLSLTSVGRGYEIAYLNVKKRAGE